MLRNCEFGHGSEMLSRPSKGILEDCFAPNSAFREIESPITNACISINRLDSNWPPDRQVAEYVHSVPLTDRRAYAAGGKDQNYHFSASQLTSVNQMRRY